MATQKRYYWLKLQDGFFTSKRIKKLRKLAGGDTYTIIYLKMQLLAMKTDGVLRWSGLEDDFASELALDLDEEPDNVAVTLQYLLSCGLAETDDNTSFFFPYAVENTGSETSSAERMRNKRAQMKLESAQCSTMCEHSDGEKEIEKETDKEVEKDTPLISPPSGGTVARVRFSPPTVEQVAEYCQERHNAVDPEQFVDFYTMKGWRVGKEPMKDWKAAVRTWEKRRKETESKDEGWSWDDFR